MAWLKAIINFKPASIGTGIKVTLRGKKTAALLLNLDLKSATTLGLSDRDKVEVLLGDSSDHGMIRIRKNNSVGEAVAELKSNVKSDYFVIKLGHQSAFVNRPEPAKWVQWEKVEDGWYEIVLPKWADETRPKLVQAPASTGVVMPAKGPAANARAFGNVVTRNIMGDPEPGRSALAQKG